MAQWRQVFRGAMPLLVAVAVCVCPPVTRAGEFYSWIDASGNMVLTDDPGQIPEPGSRSAVAVHRYQTPLPTRPEGGDPPRVHPDSGAEIEREASRSDGPSLPEAPPTAEPPEILLENPESPVRSQYTWVPLVAPIYVGSAPVYGFWCHRRVRSPVDAFTDYLRFHQELVPVVTIPGPGLNWRHREFPRSGQGARRGLGDPDQPGVSSKAIGRLSVEPARRGQIGSRSAGCCPGRPLPQGSRHRVPGR